MWEKLRVVWQIPELRKKILLTLGLLAVYRLGFQIPLPMVDPEKVKAFAGSDMASILKQVAVFSASQLDQITIFGLGIMPYISASIIFQLLGSVYPPLERLQKEGEAGRKKINEYTRYATVFICLIQSWVFVASFVPQVAKDAYLVNPGVPADGLAFTWTIVAVLTMTAGTVFLMWIGEQIDEYGIGNGISLLIMAGILARMPIALKGLWDNSTPSLSPEAGKYGIVTIALLAALFVAVVIGVIAITESQRRIPTQSAKHVRGRRVFGGTRQYLPLKVNQAGVIPIIFASSVLYFPVLLSNVVPWKGVVDFTNKYLVQPDNFVYITVYGLMIIFFTYFYTAITFNPQQQADILRKQGGFIPGIRPGPPTEKYLGTILNRITLPGALFLAAIALVPNIILRIWDVDGFPFGGTTILIAVGVALETMKQIDSQLMMRNYEGFLA